ncbi:MAG: hypothetical protein HC802_19705 [Caldilineaceae bacterium]|nr:hypothetical protein [Caldilineaceae bacterium]
MKRVKKITLTVEPNDATWGFSDLLAEMAGDSDEDHIEAVIELVNEDFHSMFEDAVWQVEFESAP